MNEPSVKLVEVKKPQHPLADLIPTCFQSFDEWLARWNSTTVLGERLGLLHCLQVMDYWPKEREQSVFFLLDVANGHLTGEPFRYRTWHDYYTGHINKNRETISRKAFDVLCVKLFASGKEGYPPLWWWTLAKQETFDKILQFCEPKAGNYDRPYDGKKGSHQAEVFGGFLQEFTRLGWAYNGRSRFYRDDQTENVEEIEARMVVARPQFIEIINYLGQLNWLNRPMSDFGSGFPALDSACLAKLKDIAFRSELLLPQQDYHASIGRRKAKTLHEAIRGGSVAAEILVLHSIRRKVDRQCAALWEESRRKHDELERQAELAKIQKAIDALDIQATKLSGG